MDWLFRSPILRSFSDCSWVGRSVRVAPLLAIVVVCAGCNTTRYVMNRFQPKEKVERKPIGWVSMERKAAENDLPFVSQEQQLAKGDAERGATFQLAAVQLASSEVDASHSSRLPRGDSQPFLVRETSPISAPHSVETGGNSDQLINAVESIELPSAGGELDKNVDKSVDEYVSEALARSAKLQAAQQRVLAVANTIPQVSALPDPVFANTFWPLQEQALQTAGGRVGNQMSLSQRVPFPDKLKTKAAVASRELQIARAEAEAIQREIIEAVRLACFEVWYASEAISVLEESRQLLVDLNRVTKSKYSTGGSQRDVIRVALESDRLEEQLFELNSQKRSAQADLAALLRQPSELVPEVTFEPQAVDAQQRIDTLIALAEECNPTLRGLSLQIQRDREREQLACLEQYPDFSLGLNWGLISDDDAISPVADGNDNLSFTFGTTLPIWRDKINAGIREAAHRRSSSARELNAERDEIRGKIRRLIVQIEALGEQKQLYKQNIIPRVEKAITLAMTDYVGGRLEFAELIVLYRDLLSYETKLARIDATIAGRFAQLERVVGCSVGR